MKKKQSRIRDRTAIIRVLELVDRANLSFADESRKGSSPFSDR